MTTDERNELRLLQTANDAGVFALGLTTALSPMQQQALERLQRRRWLSLMDVTMIAAGPGYYRLFLLSEVAILWLRDNTQPDWKPS